jgi:hypothetical protein
MNKVNKNVAITDFGNCQLPDVPKFAAKNNSHESFFILMRILLRSQWNLYYKNWLKKIYYSLADFRGLTAGQKTAKTYAPPSSFTKGEIVRIRSREEILRTLDPFSMLKGCTFFHEMFQYCGTRQTVFKVMKNFMDERDYKFKKTRGIILLENNFCSGNSAFGDCDRSCFLFWREEWLEKIVD